MLNQFRRTIRQILPRHAIVVGPRPVTVVGPAARAALVIGPSQTLTAPPRAALQVAPPRRAVWDEKGWSLDRSGRAAVYRGDFQVTERRSGQRRRFHGRIDAAHNEWVPYICEPPAGIRSHPKGPCFNLIDNGWYRIHWHRPPRNVDDAILYVERVLDEVINRRTT